MALQTPGAFFLGTLSKQEQLYIKNILEKAKQHGYTRVVEPCAGAFAMSHLAVQVGFKPSQIEASDVILFSSVYGYAIMDKPLDDLQIKATGFTKEELKDPAVVLYAIMYWKSAVSVTNDMLYTMLRDLEVQKDKHLETIRQYIDTAKKTLKGFNYRPLDMYDHLDEVMDDEKTIIIANPPTYKAGFEKWYNTKGNVTWKEPEYRIFDPVDGLRELMAERMADKKALIICYEENRVGEMVGYPIYATYGVRKDINIYLTTNQPETIERLLVGKTITRPKEKELTPLNAAILPPNHKITEKSEIGLLRLDPQTAYYYRAIWTHNFSGGVSQINVGLLVDGYLAGVFGYQTAIVKKLDYINLFYGMNQKHDTLRLGRLLTMIACNRETMAQFIPDYSIRQFDGIQTTQMTKYPESKEMRGLMKLKKKEKGKLGYKLVYATDIKDRTASETLVEFLKLEERWRQARRKSSSPKE